MLFNKCLEHILTLGNVCIKNIFSSKGSFVVFTAKIQ